ncbi:MAG: peptidylprolyl isomerase [Bacteroidales bacterium]|nr:peptidylprolyl isomerase [Candidatus Liminaster caballi]
MKKTILILATALLMVGQSDAKGDKKGSAVKDPVVMTINGVDVTRSEFEYFYTKNNEQDQSEDKSFDKYVDLFVNYKLKVHEAYSRGIDTTQNYQNELAGYRKQLAEPYLMGEDWKDQALDEVLRHRTEEVHAAHILFRLQENASPKEVSEAMAKIEDCKRQLAAGAPFDSLARALSEEPAARQSGGDLGYFSTMRMVYPFEKAAYETPVGETTVVRTSFGVHLLKVLDRRALPQDEVRLAHIMKAYDRRTPRPQAKEALSHVMDSVYQELKNGADFGQVAYKFSDDQSSARQGGLYPWLGRNNGYPKEWSDVAFSLEVGQFSEPFTTDFGWHILKLVDKRDIPEWTEEQKNQIKSQLEKDPSRGEAYRRLREDKMMAEEGLTVNAKVLAGKNRKKVAMTIGKQKYTAEKYDQWLAAKYGEEIEFVDKDEALDAWKRECINRYADEHLEERNTEFRNIYKEYHDGLMLFEVAGGEVWDKAAKDTAGLVAFFESHRKNYAWDEPLFKGAFIECADDELLVTALKKIYDNCDDIMKCADMVRAQVLTDTILTPNPKQPRFHIVNGLYAPGDNNTVDRMALKLNVEAKPARDNMPIQMTYGHVLADGPEELDDVRGKVVADYQTELENNWVAELRRKFEVKINQAELDKLKADICAEK